MAKVATVSLFGLHLNTGDFRMSGLGDNFTFNGSSGDCGLADFGGFIGCCQENLIKSDLIPCFLVNTLDFDGVAFLDQELMAAALNDC